MPRAALPLVLTICLAACATGGDAPASASRPPARVPVMGAETGGANLNVGVRDVLFRRFERTVKQRYDFSCGSASLATLLTYHYDQPTGEDEVLRDMIAHGDEERIRTLGFSLLDMQNYLARRGLRSNGYRLPLDRLAQVRVPAIALIDTNGYRHFVVVRGISADRVLLGDPNLGTRTMPRVRFEEAWNGILFVILDRPDLGQAKFGLAEDWGVRSRAPGVLVRDAMDRGVAGLGMPAPLVVYSGIPPAINLVPSAATGAAPGRFF